MLRIEESESKKHKARIKRERVVVADQIYDLAIKNDEAGLLAIQKSSNLINCVFGWEYCIDTPITRTKKENNIPAWELLCKIFDYRSTIYYSMAITQDFERIKKSINRDNLAAINSNSSEEEVKKADEMIGNTTFGMGYAISGCVKTGFAKEAKEMIDLVAQYSSERAQELIKNAIYHAVKLGDIEVLKLFTQTLDNNRNKVLEIELYARKGEADRVNQLLEDQDEQFIAVISYAKGRHFDLVRELLHKNPSESSVTQVLQIYFDKNEFNALNQLVDQEWIKPYLNFNQIAEKFRDKLVNGLNTEFKDRVFKTMAMINNPDLRHALAGWGESTLFMFGQLTPDDEVEAAKLNKLMIDGQVDFRAACEIRSLQLQLEQKQKALAAMDQEIQEVKLLKKELQIMQQKQDDIRISLSRSQDCLFSIKTKKIEQGVYEAYVSPEPCCNVM